MFVFGTLITATTAISLQYIFSSHMAKDAVTAYATSFARNTQENVTELNFKASHSVEILAHNASLTQNGKIITTSVDSLFFNLLSNNNEFYAAYIGLDNGDFYEVINLEASPLIRQNLGASLTDRYAKVIIEGSDQQRSKRTIFLNEKWEANREVAVFSEYDASVRPWFQNASSIKATKSKPYLFQHLQSPGQTYSMKIDGTKHVVAIDIALSTMSGFLSNQVNQDKSIGKSEVYLFDSIGVITASNINSSIDKNRIILPTPLSEQEQKYIEDLPAIRVSNETDWAPLDYSIAGKPRGYIVEQTEMLAHSLGLDIEYVNGVSWGTLVDYFHSGDIEILTPIYRTGTNSDWGLFSDPIVDMKMSIATLNDTPTISSMSDLEYKSVAIPKGWSIIPELRKSYPNITILEVSSVSDALSAVLKRDVYAALETNITLRYSQGIYHLSGIKITDDINIQSVQFDSNLRYLFHPKHSQLHALMNRALRNFSGDDKAYLENKWINNLSGLAKTHSTVVPYTELITSSKDPLIYGTLQEREINGKEKMLFVAPLSGVIEQYFAIVLNADDVLADSKKDVYISTAITTFIVLLLVPLCWVLANPIVRPIRELALENEKIMLRKYNSVKGIGPLFVK
ncbi:transporter substrate-binding domain-containing protein [Vibrio algarum]|uniref:Transporter substrate-binding domain-containing protein n=1 Tax=Vibrio algarum TaxID=3020714 RepID=A0ABT4YPA0_9VIBR|nr:transporter substrate-binding domain-containing protein [Vibrio sp. KJ40-1]MDB1123376.1 transporter substrate-binding domain-containing protein [Vibrio sp. KJ40-1]